MRPTIYVLVGVVVIALIGWWLWGNNEAPFTTGATVATTTATTTQQQQTNSGASAPATTNTFKSIFTESGSHECVYQQVTSSSKSQNTIDIADGKMYGQFRTTSGNQTDATLMVYDYGYLYTWKEGATTGTKTTIHTVADLPAVIPHDLTSGAVLADGPLNSVGWDCHFWAKDASVLTPPSYVKFQ